MKIGLYHHSMVEKAEFELAERMIRASRVIGHDARHCFNSDEITQFSPDYVLSLHNNFPKLTDHLTFGCMWNPPVFFGNDELGVRHVMSYDGYLFGSNRIKQYVDDLNWSTGKIFSSGTIYPTCYSTEFRQRDYATASAAYVGTNWDGPRFRRLMESLAKTGCVEFFGPLGAWDHVGEAYMGPLLFNGGSLLDQLWTSGIALCLHREEHRDWGVPNMRIFDALAASAAPICDDHPFVKEHFGELVWFVDTAKPAENVVAQVAAAVDDIRSNTRRAAERIREAHRIFVQKFSLEVLLTMACENASTQNAARQKRYDSVTRSAALPKIDCIVRTGMREPAMLRRALASIVDQQYAAVRVVIVNNGNADYVREVIAEFPSLTFHEVVIERPINRSHSLWSGLKHLQGKYFCILDDDDEYFSVHFADNLRALEADESIALSYGGGIKHLEGSVFEGMPAAEKDSRQLSYLHPFDGKKLGRGENYITSNSYLARSKFLDEDDLEDPHLEAVEDFWLLLLLLRKGKFKPCWSVVSQFSWRRSGVDNVSFKPELFLRGNERIRNRMMFADWPEYNSPSSAPFFSDADLRASKAVLAAGRAVKFAEFFSENISQSGCIDRVSRLDDETIEITGWAPWRSFHAKQHIVVSGLVSPKVLSSETQWRTDVSAHLADDEYYLSGFIVRIKCSGLSTSEEVSLHAIDEHGKAFELHGSGLLTEAFR